MMEKEYKKAREAYNQYNLNTEYKIEEKILKYIGERIRENQKEIQEMLKIEKSELTYENIKEEIEKEIKKKSEYKNQIVLKKGQNNFVSTIYKTSIGVIAIEVYELIESIRYMIKAIKSRNAVIIADVEYEEKDVKGIILLIIREAIKKFGINEDIIQRLPYEEVDYEKCDKVIYTYTNKKAMDKEKTKKLYVYVEDERLENEARKEYERLLENNEEVEIVKGNIEEVINKINTKISKGTVIYTQDPQKGYRYINLVRSENVFVNASLCNIEKMEESQDELLMNKKIMYELKNVI